MPVQREKIIQQQVANLLRSLGCGVYVLGTRRRKGDYHGTMQTPGIPDLFAFLPPYPTYVEDYDYYAAGVANTVPACLWLELKAPKGRRTPEQVAFGDACERCHVPYVWGGLDDVIAWLVRNGYLKLDSVAHYRRP